MTDKDSQSGEQQQKMLDAIAGGQKIQAIKIYRSIHGCDLKTAKENIEALAADLAEKHPEHFPEPGKAGCSTMFAAASLLGGGILALC